MKQFVRSVPTILFASAASLSLIALAGCGSSGSSNKNPSGPAAAKSVYVIQHSSTDTSEQDSVVVFSASATGNTSPSSTLMLPSDFLGLSVAVGPQGQIYVGGINASEAEEALTGQILEYSANASGSATPTVTLNGLDLFDEDATGTFVFPEYMAVNSAGTLFVSSPDNTLEAFASGFTASSAPTQYLTWGQQEGQDGYNFVEGGAPIGVDTAGDIFYMDTGSEVVDVFAANATGTTGPERTITGTNTSSFDELENIAVDGAGDVYVTNYNPTDDTSAPGPETKLGTYGTSKSAFASMLANALAIGRHGANRSMAHPHEPESDFEPTEIIEFAAGAGGAPGGNTTATPLKRIGGATDATNLTNIVEPMGLAVDAASNLYYADANGNYNSDTNPLILLEVFSPSATGNVAPVASITSSSYTYSDDIGPFNAAGVAIY